MKPKIRTTEILRDEATFLFKRQVSTAPLASSVLIKVKV